MADTRVVLITGGTRGIGAAIARARARKGDRLAIVARQASGLEAIQRQLDDQTKLCAIQADISVEADVDRIFETVQERFGGLDVLINNAGVFVAKPFEACSTAEVDSFLANLRGTMLMTRAAIPLLKGRAAGMIVNLASGAGLRGEKNHALYSACKFALVGLSQALFLELRASSIRVATVCPDSTDTWDAPAGERHLYLRADDVADVVDFLLATDPNSAVMQVALTALAAS